MMNVDSKLIDQLVHFGNLKKRTIVDEIEGKLLQIRNESTSTSYKKAKSGKNKKRSNKNF